MKKHTLFLTVALMMFCLPQTVRSWGDKEPTAIIIDAETGKPVEGAIALAQWHRAAGGAAFEGGSEALAKAVEVFSDKDGKVFIDGFWGLYFFSRKPSLTVFKPGYVLWDSRFFCPTFEPRSDFDEHNITVKLLKFETEAARWVKEYPNRARGLPRSMHDLFFSHCYDSEAAPKFNITFRDIFFKYERPLIDAEETMRK